MLHCISRAIKRTPSTCKLFTEKSFGNNKKCELMVHDGLPAAGNSIMLAVSVSTTTMYRVIVILSLVSQSVME